jgi:hypothetical protein
VHYLLVSGGVVIGLGIAYVVYRYGRYVEQKAQNLARKL